MKTIFKLAAVAAAFGLAPAAALGAVPGAPPGTTDTPTAAPAAVPAAVPAPAPAPAEATPATANAAAPATPAAALPRTAPTAGIGQPDGRLGLQEQVSPIGQEAAWFHNVILMPLITVISAFVLLLLGWVMFRYRRSRNPTPSRNTHNTTLEVVWTLVPVLILVVIAVPSIRLLAHQYDPPRADVTIKAIGNQWWWDYEYQDHGNFTITSRILTDAQAAARGEPRQLAVGDRMVVPVGTTIRMIVTSNDVIHAWGVPAFWTKIDAVPGRLNETWFRADRTGVFYGVCYELCGAQHGYMPIAVEVVTQEQFRAWVAAQPGGHMPGAQPAAASAPAAAPAGGNTIAGAETPATTNQSATR
jgi:cytochrome c oxidase subunit 2